MGNQPLDFRLMTLSKVIRAHEVVSASPSGQATTNMSWIGQKIAQPKSPPKIARSALPGVPIAGASVTDHSQRVPLCHGFQ